MIEPLRRAQAILPFLLLVTACGNAEIVVPEPLWVIDTFPSQGALIPAGDVPVVVTFSAAVDEETLADAVLLEHISDSGAPIDVVPTALGEYLEESHTASFQAPSLPADTAYSLTIRADAVKALDGATLLADVVRRFKTDTDP
ncbi:MAG: Ig-like domain-containing protein [Myxococcales bacterium]|nr:Ig-like domain-containing protein [Myxococcales bacterium]MCB9645171.1 Ig-like domain-containing protein [Deltaproteobacteria bacterium]